MIVAETSKRPVNQKLGDWREIHTLEKAAVKKHGEPSIRAAYEKAGVDLTKPYNVSTFKAKRTVLASFGFNAAKLPEYLQAETPAPVTELSVPVTKPKLFVDGKVNLPPKIEQPTKNAGEIAKLETMRSTLTPGSVSERCLVSKIAALKK